MEWYLLVETTLAEATLDDGNVWLYQRFEESLEVGVEANELSEGPEKLDRLLLNSEVLVIHRLLDQTTQGLVVLLEVVGFDPVEI